MINLLRCSLRDIYSTIRGKFILSSYGLRLSYFFARFRSINVLGQFPRRRFLAALDAKNTSTRFPPSALALTLSWFALGDENDRSAAWSSFDGGAGIGSAEDELFSAAKTNDAECIHRLVKKGIDPNRRHALGWTALHVAAFHGCTQAVAALLENGASVDAADEFSTFHEIAKRKRMNLMDALWIRQEEFSGRLRANANYRGTTPLHYAVLADKVDVIEILMKNGADPTLENEAGHLAVDYAKDSKTRNLLEEYSQNFAAEKKRRDLEERLKFPLEQRLKEHIIGQEGAIATVAATIRRKQNGWYDDEHPLVFIFLGSSGIGKTEVAKQVAKYLHKDVKKGFIRIDMSEYQQKHEVAKFIGSPPGYVGYDEGGQLTKKLKECPNAVVLFDEIEKAHPDILTIMLQLFDEGRLTDGKGNTVDCKDAIFIMTSNLASDEIANYGVKLREEASKLYKERMDVSVPLESSESVIVSKQFKEKIVQPILKRHFKRDEFLGRITEMVYFLPFSRTELISLVIKELEAWRRRAMDKHKIEIAWDRNVLEVLADGYNVHYGARSIKHEVERRVVNKLAAAYEKQIIKEGCTVKIYTNLNADSLQDSSIRENATIDFDIINKSTDNENFVGNMPLTDRIKKAITGLV